VTVPSSITATLTLTTFPVSVRTLVGLTAMVYTEATATGPSVLKGVGTIISQVDGVSITLASPISVVTGDTIVIGARTMKVYSTYFNLKAEATARAAKVGFRYDLFSRSGSGTGGGLQQAFVSTVVRTEQKFDGVPIAKDNTLTGETPELPYSWLRHDLPDATVHEDSMRLGSSTGINHQVKLTFVGGAQVRLHDLYVEVQ
jgi:hypothetical protein